MTEGQELGEILLVEDSATQAAAVTIQLEEAGFVVHHRPTLRAALALLEEAAPDAVLLDLELPDASALSGLEQIVAAHRAIPVVVLTSEHGEELALRALARGAEDYLPKHEMTSSTLRRAIHYAIERHRTRNELDRLNRQKDHLMAVVAHDLRNPLGVMRGYADFLLSGVTGELEGEQEEIVQTMRKTASYMVGLVEDLLDLGRIQAGAMELERAETDLGALVREGVRLNAVVAREKQIGFETEVEAELPSISLDRHKVRQVLDNLLSNAVKFSHPESTVHVSLSRDGEHARLTVSDQGVGMPARDLPKVFRPFERTGARPTGGERSTGLGLAIVRNIVEAHGGRIWVESEEGRGSAFHVTLPFG
ncbi:MAG: hybrid sensor histidine kinase/response regulator [Myxococcota bacterium]|nr:hybrid sensor histidine kinase/response regulator [Myxococcota bacterium]